MAIIPQAVGLDARGISERENAAQEGPGTGDLGAASPSQVAPPTSNTGAQNTQRGIVVDWVSTTFPPDMPLKEVLQLLGVSGRMEFEATERGAMGYRSGLVRGHVKLYYDGMETMGVHVVMSGKGCRQFEAENGFEDGTAWQAWFKAMQEAGAKFSRFDYALDDFDFHYRPGLLSMEQIRQAVYGKQCVTRFNHITSSERVKACDGSRTGEVIHFGSIQSEKSVCIYDKAKEQELDPHIHWIRVELRAKKDQATAAVEAFVKQGAASLVSILFGCIDFKEPSDDSNRSRWETVSWWTTFLETMKKLALTVKPEVRTVEKIKQWLFHQVAPSLAVVLEAAGGDLDSLLDIAVSGRDRLRAVHRAMLLAHNPA